MGSVDGHTHKLSSRHLLPGPIGRLVPTSRVCTAAANVSRAEQAEEWVPATSAGMTVGGTRPSHGAGKHRDDSDKKLSPSPRAARILRSSISRGHSGSSWETAGDGRASGRRRRYSATSDGCRSPEAVVRRPEGQEPPFENGCAVARGPVARRGTTLVTRSEAGWSHPNPNCKRARPSRSAPLGLAVAQRSISLSCINIKRNKDARNRPPIASPWTT